MRALYIYIDICIYIYIYSVCRCSHTRYIKATPLDRAKHDTQILHAHTSGIVLVP